MATSLLAPGRRDRVIVSLDSFRRTVLREPLSLLVRVDLLSAANTSARAFPFTVIVLLVFGRLAGSTFSLDGIFGNGLLIGESPLPACFFSSDVGDFLTGCLRLVGDFDAVERIDVVEGVLRTASCLPAVAVLVVEAVETFRTRLAAVVDADLTLASEERRGRFPGNGGGGVWGERDADVRTEMLETVDVVETFRVRDERDSRGVANVDDDAVDSSFLLALDATDGGRAGTLGGRRVADVDALPVAAAAAWFLRMVDACERVDDTEATDGAIDFGRCTFVTAIW